MGGGGGSRGAKQNRYSLRCRRTRVAKPTKPAPRRNSTAGSGRGTTGSDTKCSALEVAEAVPTAIKKTRSIGPTLCILENALDLPCGTLHSNQQLLPRFHRAVFDESWRGLPIVGKRVFPYP